MDDYNYQSPTQDDEDYPMLDDTPGLEIPNNLFIYFLLSLAASAPRNPITVSTLPSLLWESVLTWFPPRSPRKCAEQSLVMITAPISQVAVAHCTAVPTQKCW